MTNTRTVFVGHSECTVTGMQSWGGIMDAASTDVLHANFLTSVKVYIGVACVLAVHACLIVLPNDHYRERTLGVLRLWQDVLNTTECVHACIIFLD